MKKLILLAGAAALLSSCNKEQTYYCECFNNGADLGVTNIQAKRRVDAQSDCAGIQTTFRKKGSAYSATVCGVKYQ